MKRGTPESFGFRPGDSTISVGRARRWMLLASQNESTSQSELWRLDRQDEPVVRRLLDLGRSGIAGFVDGGVDDEGAWLVRGALGAFLARRMRGKTSPDPWREAVRTGMDIARALAACERLHLFPGPLTPDAISVRDDDSIVLLAQPLVLALVGSDLGAGRGSDAVSPLWTPPEQARGALWDSAANRYALGLVVYRLLAGAHPFAGGGLRQALNEAAQRDPPPFDDAVASALPPGLQSLVLRMLDPDPTRRPSSADRLQSELLRFMNEEPARPADAIAEPSRDVMTLKAVPPADEARPAENHDRASRRRAAGDRRLERLARRGWPLAASAGVVALALAAWSPTPPVSPRPSVRAQVPLAQATTNAEQCAECHSRQASEWQRSIMAHSVKSPLFNALESLIEEQVGRDRDCPHGAGILRRAEGATACRDTTSGLTVTGSGGEHWCVNCHSPMEKLGAPMPAWEGRSGGDARTRQPVRDLVDSHAMEGISCAFCHEVHGPAGNGANRGNPTWTSFATGATFSARPEERRGIFGIGNSGYELRPDDFLVLGRADRGRGQPSDGADDLAAHRRPSNASRAYLRSSEFCGSCHDVRLFGTDALHRDTGEHFKRLRNAYSEWADWANREQRAGRPAATCQDCHMSTYPGICEPAPGTVAGADADCPSGTKFVATRPGEWPRGRVADTSRSPIDVVTHSFSGVDLPLAREFPEALVGGDAVDLNGIPQSARLRRNMLLRATFRFGIGEARRVGQRVEIPIQIENVGAGHRVPAGFSQEREIWVHLVVKDPAGRVLYEVGRVDRPDEDLRDKVFARVNTIGDREDDRGRPLGLFGADVRDGPDVPRWEPPPLLGGSSFRGRGLINFQNGFLRCVRCIGSIDTDGACQPLPGQESARGDRFADGDYDIDTGECRSNLTGHNALFETYFPVGSLDASRGTVKGPDAIVDTRSLPPGVPIRYTYDLPIARRDASSDSLRVEARLLFRAFPPYLIRAFAGYERDQARRGLRPSGPLVSLDMLDRIEVVEVAKSAVEIR